MLERVYGKTNDPVATSQLVSQLDELGLDGTVYVGYPVLASADETTFIKALLVSPQHGLVVFDLPNGVPPSPDTSFWSSLEQKQDRLFYALSNNLGRHEALRKGRELGVHVNVITFFPTDVAVPPGSKALAAGPTQLSKFVGEFRAIDPEYLKPLNAALQRVTTIKPSKKRSAVSRSGSRGAILKEIEREIANLDQWQKRAAIESPEGPQRIRGLAGSGKTIVLALKAAYLHAHNPDWNIVLTFHTRSLYQQLIDLVRRFSFEHLNDEPNFEKLRIMHAWGGPQRSGVYADIAAKLDLPVRDFIYARTAYGMKDAFAGVCTELLSHIENEESTPIYDAILIDEAQDLSAPFFHLAYRFCSNPKRLIWAYDELQTLSETSMPSLSELFGVNEDGSPKVELINSEGEPRQDIVLPVCYRNTSWALTLAHALGLGIYRSPGGLVQFLDDPMLWTEIGYDVVSGELTPGHRVVLERKQGAHPQYFRDLLTSEDAVQCHVFENQMTQAEWVASQIKVNLTTDELEADDILIVLPDPITARREATHIANALLRYGIPSHLVGVTTSQDEVFRSGSVAIVNIHRAKGNEAPMVYILNSQHCYVGHELTKLRNVLFTGVTRSRAWVRLCGWGSSMHGLKREFDQVRDSHFRLSFSVPSTDELLQLRRIHRERTASERARIQQVERGLDDFLRAIEEGDLSFQTLPPDMRVRLQSIIDRQRDVDDTY